MYMFAFYSPPQRRSYDFDIIKSLIIIYAKKVKI